MFEKKFDRGSSTSYTCLFRGLSTGKTSRRPASVWPRIYRTIGERPHVHVGRKVVRLPPIQASQARYSDPLIVRDRRVSPVSCTTYTLFGTAIRVTNICAPFQR